jgi:dihydroorotate dehydrogenase
VYALALPFLSVLDAERAHDFGLRALEAAWRLGLSPVLGARAPSLPVEVLGIRFPNPVGLAAGLDKNGAHIRALAALGFGFIEVGTVTPRPQPGNPRPRMYRLPEHRAVINRLGFNNEGVDALARNVERAAFDGVLGINIGRNKDTPNEQAAEDYLTCLERVYPLASYVTVNVSSPNTQDLRGLQEKEPLRAFIARLREGQERLASRHRARKPMLLKIAPDLNDAGMDAIAEVLLGAGVDGVICTNTTVDRTAVAGHPLAGEAGGLSGAPVMAPSTRVLRGMAERFEGRVPLVGVGGILSGADARTKVEAGASLLQLYTGLIYRGPGLVAECVEALRDFERAA